MGQTSCQRGPREQPHMWKTLAGLRRHATPRASGATRTTRDHWRGRKQPPHGLRLVDSSLQVDEDFFRVLGGAHLRVSLFDFSVGPNEVADALRRRRLRVVASAIREADRPLRVAKKRVVEIELLGEGRVLSDGVEADPENRGALLRELLASVAEPATLSRSPWRIRLRKEPKDDVTTAIVRELDGGARVI